MTVDSADAVRASPLEGFVPAPGRIDDILARGAGIEVTGSRALTERLPEHQTTPLGKEWPFYSDHGAVVTDLCLT